MTALLYVLAAIGGWFLVSVALLLVWIAANEHAGRRKPDRDTAAARQIGGWR